MKNKQKEALEKVTGKPWNNWHPEAVKAYFAYTDRGEVAEVSDEARDDFNELLYTHKFHAYTIECWKEDFKKGSLFIDDFLDEPPARIKHALEIYFSVFGYIPSKYAN